jgi:hypothetical protein
MKYILSRGGREALRRCAESSGLVALNFDRTLAPIVSDPQIAEMRPATWRLLQSIARPHPCIVVSGRSRSEVWHRLKGVEVREVAGRVPRPFAGGIKALRPQGCGGRSEVTLSIFSCWLRHPFAV